MKNHADEHEAFAASRSSEHVYVPIDDRNFITLDKHAETIEMDAKLPLVRLISWPTLCQEDLLEYDICGTQWLTFSLRLLNYPLMIGRSL